MNSDAAFREQLRLFALQKQDAYRPEEPNEWRLDAVAGQCGYWAYRLRVDPQDVEPEPAAALVCRLVGAAISPERSDK